MPGLTGQEFEGTLNDERWTFTDADLDCLLLTLDHGDSGDHYLMRFLEILKYTNPEKYKDSSERRLAKVLRDLRRSSPGHLDEWHQLDQRDPRIRSAEEKYKNIPSQILERLLPNLEIVKKLEDIEEEILDMIAMLRNARIDGVYKEWFHISSGLNKVFPKYKHNKTPFNAKNVEIICRCLVLSNHNGIYRRWAYETDIHNFDGKMKTYMDTFEKAMRHIILES
ncbi:MAG: hypothetical protein LQ351_008018 [Letrouitia transgressa]|nr:MAG: hypothetical protein LQ351_008018 [Letrouitia transgressa]